jgi:carboxypeptidase Q
MNRLPHKICGRTCRAVLCMEGGTRAVLATGLMHWQNQAMSTPFLRKAPPVVDIRGWHKTIGYTLTLLALACLGQNYGHAGESVDLAVVHRIKTEAFNNSKVMDHLFYLTDANGPRLTGSPGWDSAADWVMRTLKQYGLEQVHLEPWGQSTRGWSYSAFELAMTKPTFTPLHGIPKAWCAGTRGAVHGSVMATPLLHEDESARDLDIATIQERIAEFKDRWKDKLRGKIALLGQPRDFEEPTAPESSRLDEKGLSSLVKESDLVPTAKPGWIPNRLPRDPKKRAELFRNLPLEMMADYWQRKLRAYAPLDLYLKEQGVVAVLETDKRGTGGIVFAEAASDPQDPAPPPTISLVPEQFNRLWRLAEKNIPVEVELTLTVNTVGSAKTANRIAEIPGGNKKDEVVMLGAHLDSWHAGTGATDNGAGSAVTMEAIRILKALHLKMDRTVRLALWSGEEQGLFGSRAYVREHFADPLNLSLKPEHARLCAYFNLDNGSGKIRGIHLQDNDMVRPLFDSWFAPFKDLGADTVTIRGTGGTDHLSFDAVGLPGFQFIQDPLDYGTRTHHSELDVYDHAQPGDLMQASAIMASFVYNAANRAEMLPRKPLPDPLPPKPE